MTRHRRALRPAAAWALIALLGLPSAAAAQEQRLFALTFGVVGSAWQSQLLEARLVDGRVVSVTQPATLPGRADRSGPIVAAGGRYVVWEQAEALGAAAGLVLFDRVTGQLSVGPTYEGVAGAVSDPTQPRLYFAYGLGLPSDKPLARLTPAGLGVLPGTAGLRPLAVSADGQRVYTVRTAFPAPGDTGLAVVDATTGAVLTDITFSTSIGEVGGLAVSRDQTTLWLMSIDCGSCTTRTWTLRRFDLGTGTETLALPFAPVARPLLESATPPVVDNETGRVVVATSRTYLGIYQDTTDGAVIEFDGESGHEVTRTMVEGRSAIALDPSTQAVLAVSQSEYRGPDASHSCGGPVVRVFQLPHATAPSTSASSASLCVSAAFASTPMPPQLAAADVSPVRTVTLTWTPTPDFTTGFVVEAGTDPGLTNIASFSTAGHALVVPGVPPGRYYVRVRARNDIGLGVPSNEVMVDVQ